MNLGGEGWSRVGCCLQTRIAWDLDPAANACSPAICRNYDRKRDSGCVGAEWGGAMNARPGR